MEKFCCQCTCVRDTLDFDIYLCANMHIYTYTRHSLFSFIMKFKYHLYNSLCSYIMAFIQYTSVCICIYERDIFDIVKMNILDKKEPFLFQVRSSHGH